MCLETGVLRYQKRGKSDRTSQELPLEGAYVTPVDANRIGKKYAFQVVTPYRTYFWRTNNAELTEEWIRAIQAAINYCTDSFMVDFKASPNRRSAGGTFSNYLGHHEF
eukprot:260699_1